MSRENVELIRRGYERDAERLEPQWDTIDPHILLRTDARWPEQRIYGREAAIAWYRDLWESGGPDVRIEEIMDLGDRVLVRLCWHMRGLRSGVEGEQRTSVIRTFREGRVILEEYFLEHEQALEAVRLSE